MTHATPLNSRQPPPSEPLLFGILQVIAQRVDKPTDIELLENHLGTSRSELQAAINQLRHRGLLQAEKLRLTMVGLIVARSRAKLRAILAA